MLAPRPWWHNPLFWTPIAILLCVLLLVLMTQGRHAPIPEGFVGARDTDVRLREIRKLDELLKQMSEDKTNPERVYDLEEYFEQRGISRS